MVLNCLKATPRVKGVNATQLKKRASPGVKGPKDSKQEAEKVVAPLCQSINLFTNRCDKTKKQAWDDEICFGVVEHKHLVNVRSTLNLCNPTQSLPLQLHGVLHRLGVIGAPTVLKQLVTFMMLSMGTISMNLDAVEYFAGEQAVT